MKKLLIILVPLAVMMVAGCSQQQDIGDADKPPPAGAQPPGAPAKGGPTPSATVQAK